MSQFNNTIFWCFLLSFNFFCQLGYSQTIDPAFNLSDTSQVHIVIFKNDDIMVGRVTYINDESIYFLFHGNTTQLDRNNINIIKVKSSDNILDYDSEIQQGHESIILNQTAYSLKKGKGEYRTYYGLGHLIDYGLSDNIDIGAGVIIPFIGILRAKVATNFDKSLFNFGVSGQALLLFSIFDENQAVINLNTHLTVGKPSKFLNISVGMLWPTEYADERIFSFSLGGAIPINKNWRFTMDNTLFYNPMYDESYFLPVLGLSWLNKKNRFDAGLSHYIDFTYDESRTIPYITYARRF